MDLGDRMKLYEGQHMHTFTPLLPIVARLDGKAFHTFTRKLSRPFDEAFVDLMRDTTRWLVEETCARIGYTQSDEITLIFYSPDMRSQVYFDGRREKLNSVLASMATAYFNRGVINSEYLRERCPEFAFFDCRSFVVPTLIEACNVLQWREQDATRNSVLMLAQSHFSHKQMQGKKVPDLHDMLHEIGVNWNDLPDRLKRGSYFQRRKIVRAFTTDELDKLPEKHAARTNPNLTVERSDTVYVDMPPFTKITNKCDVVFEGAEPETINS